MKNPAKYGSTPTSQIPPRPVEVESPSVRTERRNPVTTDGTATRKLRTPPSRPYQSHWDDDEDEALF